MKQLMIGAMLLAATSGAVSVQAQTGTLRQFVDGGVLVDVDGNAYTDGAQTSPGLMAAIGTSLPRNWTVRFEATLPGRHDTASSYSSSTRKTSEVAQHRIETYAFLFGKDWALSPRTTFTALAGVSAARHVDHEEYTIETTRLGIVSTMSETDDSSDVISTVAFGADVAVAVTRRLSIVPGFRAHAPLGYDSWFNIWRPGISVRWKF